MTTAAFRASKDALAKAMAANDLVAIRAVVAEARAVLGDKAGTPEVADDFKKPPTGATLLTHAEAQRGFMPHFSKLEKMRWLTSVGTSLSAAFSAKLSPPPSSTRQQRSGSTKG